MQFNNAHNSLKNIVKNQHWYKFTIQTLNNVFTF